MFAFERQQQLLPALMHKAEERDSKKSARIIEGRDLAGQILDARYKVIKLLGSGSFGQVYECIDTQSPTIKGLQSDKLVVKISENFKMIAREIRALDAIYKYDK